jgi:hypothetical protein
MALDMEMLSLLRIIHMVYVCPFVYGPAELPFEMLSAKSSDILDLDTIQIDEPHPDKAINASS